MIPDARAPISLRLAHSLNAQIFEIKKAGHFNKSDGFADFPQLLDIIKQCRQMSCKMLQAFK